MTHYFRTHEFKALAPAVQRDQVRAFLRSPEFRLLPAADQRIRAAEVQAAINGAPDVPAPATVTPETARAYFASAAYRGLPREQKRQRFEELAAAAAKRGSG